MLLIFQLIIDVLLFFILITILIIIGTRLCRSATQVGTALKFIASFVLLMLLAVVYRVIANIIVLSHGQENSNGIVSTTQFFTFYGILIKSLFTSIAGRDRLGHLTVPLVPSDDMGGRNWRLRRLYELLVPYLRVSEHAIGHLLKLETGKYLHQGHRYDEWEHKWQKSCLVQSIKRLLSRPWASAN